MKMISAIISIFDESTIGRHIVLFYSGLIGAVFNMATPVESWIQSNGGYIGFIMYAITFDFILGLIVDVKRGRFNFKETFSDLGIKMLAIFGFGILFEGVKQIHTTDMAVTEYLLYTVRMMVFLYPVFSASKRMSSLTNGVFPPEGWFKWMDNFKKELKTDKTEEVNKDER